MKRIIYNLDDQFTARESKSPQKSPSARPSGEAPAGRSSRPSNVKANPKSHAHVNSGWYQIEEEDSADEVSEMSSYVNIGSALMH